MPLPPLPAWLIDYVTAREVFAGPDTRAQSVVIAMCATGTMKYCGCEMTSFKADQSVKPHFHDHQNCRCNLNGEIIGAASAFPDKINGKRLNASDNTTRLMVACAINCNYGIVSSKSGMFLTPVELGKHYGVSSLTLKQFIARC